MKTNWFKRTLCSILAFVMVLGYVPATAFASAEDGLCEHHTQHTTECGYSAAVAGHDCGHAHTEECYQSVTECVHTHGDCGYVPAVEGQSCDCQPDENGEIVHTEGCGYVEAVAEIPCDHVCSEETGCVTKALNCQHQHDAACGYAKETAETPCGFECADCAEGASDEPAPTEYYGSTATEADTTWGLRGASTFSLEGNSSDSLSSGFYRITTKLDREYKLTLSSSSYSCVTTGESDAQVFYVSQLENGYFVIYDSSKTSVVTARSSEFAENTQMELREYSEILQQHWFILPADGEDGSYYIVTAENDMFLDLDNATCEENAVVKLFPRNGGYDSQNWFFEPCENYGDSDNCSCSEQYAGNYVVSNTSEVAIRDGHSITSRLLGRIPLGTEISITKASGAAGNSDAWGHVTYNGISGCIPMCYVKQQSESLGSGDCGAEGNNVTWNLTSDGTLTISGSGKMKNYTSKEGVPWYDKLSQMKTVAIEQGVTSIGGHAFSYCRSLTSVTIPNSVTSIETNAFYGCSSLTSVTIPNSVTSIGSGAFYECRSLTSVTIPNSVSSISYSTFSCCSSLASVTIPSSITSIDDWAFSDCSSLTSVTIPSSVISIGEYAFCDCSSLTSVTIPNSVTSIGEHAFCDCSSLTSVTIPNSVTSIGDSAFFRCSSLISVTIPNSVSSISYSTFSCCSSLASVTIPSSITSIDDWAFSHCSSLTSVTIPNGVASIGEYAFRACSSLTSVTIPSSVTSIGENAFSHCSSLTDINVDPNNKYWCSVDGVFFSKDMKTLVTYPSGRTGAYECPEGITSINDFAFYGSSSLTSVTIPSSVISIGEYAFLDCSSLTSVTIPNSVTSIGEYAFCDCSSLTSVTIPNSVTSIGKYAFSDCDSLTSVTIPSSVISIGEYAFRHCSSLTSVTIPSSITSIDDWAFSGCSSLTSVTIPNSVTSIGKYAFSDCDSLTSVTIPSSVISIGEYAFRDCSSLKDVYYSGTEAQWNQLSIGDDNSELTNATIHYNSNGSSSELTLVSTSPAAGATNVALDEPLVLTFSQDISEQLDWSKGKLCIIDYDTHRSVLEVGADKFAELGGYVDGKDLVIPSAFTSKWILFSVSGKMTVRIPDGLVSAKESENGEAIRYEGLQEGDDLTFTLKRNVISTGFDVKKDAFRFDNSEDYFDKPYSYRPADLALLYSKLDAASRLLLMMDIASGAASGFTGMCFGMSALMGLFQSQKLDISQIESNATCGAELPMPKESKTLYSYLSYYHFLQMVVGENFFNIGYDFKQSEWGRRLVSALKKGENPVMLNVRADGGHSVLAYAIDEVSDPDNYIIYVADPNLLHCSTVIDNVPVESSIWEMEPVLLYVDKNTFQIGNTYLMGTYQEKMTDFGYRYTSFTGVTELSAFDSYSIQDISLQTGLQNLIRDSLLYTNATHFIVIAEEKAADISNGVISGNLKISGPFQKSNGSADEMQAYHIEDCNTYTLRFNDAQPRTVYLRFANSDQAVTVESDAKQITLTPDGSISITGAASQSKLFVSLDENDTDVFAFALTTDAGDISLTPQGDGSFKVESEEPIGNITVESINPTHDAGSVTENVSGTSAIAAPVQDDQYEIIESNNYTIEVGANGKWQKGSKQALVFESNGPVDKFEKLVLDGADLADVNYTVSEKSGNAVVSLKAEYLQTLEAGQYSLYFSFTDGKTSDISFTVEELFNRLDLSPYDDFNNQAEIFIDGVPYPIESSNGRCVNIPRDAGFATSYQIHNSNSDDVHLRYPEGMMVYRIVHSDDGIAKLEKIDAFTNLLQYSGSSIRITGNKGIRMITSVNQDTRNALTGNGLAGFKLLEYGTLLAQTSKLKDNPLVLGGGDYVKSNYAYKKGVADPVFKYANGLIQYTNVLVGFTDDQCAEDIAMRPYMKLLDENGEEFVIYGGIVYRSIGYIAYQNRNAFQPRSAAYEYVWSIIHNVYGTKYDSEYRK